MLIPVEGTPVERDAQAAEVVRFGLFEVDLRAGELHKSGRRIRLQEQPFQILVMLLERSGGVVTHDELRQKLWADGTFVDFDHGIRAAINKIREALADSADNPRFVETLPRRGYRFIAPVERVAPVPSLATPKAAMPDLLGGDRRPESPIQERQPEKESSFVERRSLSPRPLTLAMVGVIALIAITVGLNVGGMRDRLVTSEGARHGTPLPKIESIAVLPLENLSHDPEQEYFADGMTEALITNLGKIHALRVISRTTAMHYKGTKKTLPQIARELNVDAIVEGTVLRSGDRVRVTANLLHAPTDRHLWADSYEREIRDVLLLQGEVARAIADEVSVKLTSQERAHLETTRRVNPGAQMAYLKGLYFVNRWPASDFSKCAEYLEEATLKDPNYAEAYAVKALCYTHMVWVQPPKEVFPRVKAAALRSLQIDNSLAQGHSALGNAKLFFDWDWAGAEKELKLAVDLNPSNALGHVWYSDPFLFTGRFDEAIAEARKAVNLDPASLLTNRSLTFNYLMARRSDEAIAQAEATLEIDPANVVTQADIACAYLLKGEEARARAEAARFGFADDPFFVPPATHKDALRGLERDLGLNAASSKEYVDPFYIAMQYAHLGNKDRAFEWLSKAYEGKSAMMVQLNVNPEMDSLRSDPRFQDLLRRMKFPE